MAIWRGTESKEVGNRQWKVGGIKGGQVRSDLEGWGLRWALTKPTLSLRQKRGTARCGLDSATPEAERSNRETHGGHCTESGRHHSLSTPNKFTQGLRPDQRHFRSPLRSRMWSRRRGAPF